MQSEHTQRGGLGRRPRAAGPAGSAATDTGQSARPHGEFRILLIEDSVLLQERLTELLTQPGVMRVTGTAATEREAKERIVSDEYDVLLVDVELREGSGIGAIAHARSSCEGSQPLIIVLTNYPLPAVRTRCLAAGADYFLDKMRQFQDVKPLIAAAHRQAGGPEGKL